VTVKMTWLNWRIRRMTTRIIRIPTRVAILCPLHTDRQKSKKMDSPCQQRSVRKTPTNIWMLTTTRAVFYIFPNEFRLKFNSVCLARKCPRENADWNWDWTWIWTIFWHMFQKIRKLHRNVDFIQNSCRLVPFECNRNPGGSHSKLCLTL